MVDLNQLAVVFAKVILKGGFEEFEYPILAIIDLILFAISKINCMNNL